IATIHAAPLALACALLIVRVLADAVLCDLDDADSDRRFGTQTLPNHLGRNRAWSVAFGLRIAVAVALVSIPVLPMWPRLAWALVTVVSSTWLWLSAPGHVRDWIDARFAVEAACVTVILHVAYH
ncbi:MAG TPA: hypothetical protein VFC46_12240, partial [Humisphaera sp.]|nr:hypothetical protein [Humisphaera sp.]